MIRRICKLNADCEHCLNFVYDEEYDEYICGVDMDEDEAARLFGQKRNVCPYFRFGDDYTIVRKQN
ncbi:MAG: hypothetical protein E7389_00830 [Ruminococcaceae bacterium]|nr:hypothetical protein [Oscillospiraceae bacterium]